jgi:hypothetical protein
LLSGTIALTNHSEEPFDLPHVVDRTRTEDHVILLAGWNLECIDIINIKIDVEILGGLREPSPPEPQSPGESNAAIGKS